MGEALGKLLAVAIDALTPRSVRMLVLALACLNGYGWWLHDSRLQAQERSLVAYQVEMAGMRADLKAVLKSGEEGNEELRAIRKWLMERPR